MPFADMPRVRMPTMPMPTVCMPIAQINGGMPMLPMLIVYIFFQKQLTKGITAGAVKG